jgi:hypothetical protein
MIVTNRHVRLYNHHHHHLLVKEPGHSLTDLSLVRLVASSKVFQISLIRVVWNITVVKMPVSLYYHDLLNRVGFNI